MNDLERLQQGRHHDPFDYLGRHPHGDGWVIRAFMPTAQAVELVGAGPMTRVEGSDLFVIRLSEEENAALPRHYRLRWQEADGHWHETVSPYSFDPQLSEWDLHLFNEGRHHHAWRFLGAHMKTIDGVEGCLFAVWAPAVQRVSVVGDFNAWHGLRHPMRNRGHSGVWELFIPGLRPGDAYKFEILGRQDQLLVKADPYARRMAMRPDTTSIIEGQSRHAWGDADWLRRRERWDWQREPVAIYEVHAGSWKRHPDGSFYSYTELADSLLPEVRALGYTHIELLPLMEHPLDESWGYQVSGYYAPTARHGTPDQLRAFIDRAHQLGLGVILDWVPAHFPRDEFALARFTGEPLYEHADPRRGEHRDWGTLIFDYGRNEVRNFLVANALYWIEEFHVDGLRVDAVASMLYLDYSRQDGDWVPNQYGGRENLEAIAFLRELNEVVHARFPGAVTIAEESTAWPMVSRPTYMGGLGFSMKWNMGWMHDTLSYFQTDPIFRKYHHNQLTFSQLYLWTENFVLPFSHDEVVHLKKSMLDKMPGDPWQKFANLRLLYCYQYAHPGKKLLFMGSEFGQWREWDALGELDWALLEKPEHQGVRKVVSDLNHLYVHEAALHQTDFDAEGFQWIDCHDSEQSVLSFIRRAADDPQDFLVCIFNFTPVPRLGYRIGVPPARAYREVLNTDSVWYGGSNVGNAGRLALEETPWMGFEHSLALTLPPLAGLILKPEL